MIAAIVLAAGASRRFGAQKLLAPLAGRPLVRWTVENVLEARPDDVIVVLGRDGERVREALRGLAVRCVVNEQWADGMSGSLRAGVLAVPHVADAVLIALGDQPGVGVDIIVSLMAASATGKGPIVAPSYRGERGNPVLFDAALFPELLTVRGDRGARDLLARDPSRVTLVEFDRPAPADVDREEDLRLVRQARSL